MRSLAILAIVTLGFLVLLPADAGQEERHTLKFAPVTLEKGDVATLDGRLGFDIYFEDGKTRKRTAFDVADAWIAHVRADEVDGQGVLRRGVAFFPSGGIKKEDGEYDQSIAGARVTVNGSRCSEAGGLSTPSAHTLRWLDDHFAKRCLPELRLDWTAALEPGKPVALGERWDPDYRALAKHFSQVWDCALEPKGATGTALFEEYFQRRGAPVATIEAKLKFPLKAAPRRGLGQRATLPSDATMSVYIRARFALEGRLPFREVLTNARYRGDATAVSRGTLHASVHAHWGLDKAEPDDIPAPKR